MKTKLLFFIILLGLCTILAAWFLLHGDILFHTDIARDFLLIEDIVKVKPITLLGPRSGGIPGVFHGPLWLYLNVPAFIIGGGNPLVVGWFWLILFFVLIGLVYYVASKLINEEAGLFSALLVSVAVAHSVRDMFNPFGAVLVTPTFFYLYYLYITKKAGKYLLASLFLLGMIVQFQMAFGIPLLFLTGLHALYLILRRRKWAHILCFLILLIPLSTFFLFDIKHQFLQTKAVFRYMSGEDIVGKLDKDFKSIIYDRWHGATTDTLSFISRGNVYINWLFFISLPLALYKAYKKKDMNGMVSMALFLYFYIGYWVISILFKGTIWNYYYWPFLPLLAIMLVRSLYVFPTRLFYLLFGVIFLFNFYHELGYIVDSAGFFGKDGSSWKFNLQIANQVFEKGDKEFGYYILTTDQYGYSPRYAMNYAQGLNKQKKAFPFEKKKDTFLIISRITNPFLDEKWWREHQVNIKTTPVSVSNYDNGFKMEYYLLKEDDLNLPSDQNLIHTLIFR